MYRYVNSLPSLIPLAYSSIGEQTRIGLKYRRHNASLDYWIHSSIVTTYPSFLSQVNITSEGVLLQPLSSVISLLNQKIGNLESRNGNNGWCIVDNEVLPEPATFSIEWYYHKVQNAAFIGRFYVLGKGDVYVFYSLKNQVSVRDVYHFGENV